MNETENKGKKRKILLIVCALAVVLVGGYLLLCAAGSKDVIYPNVTAAGAELGGLTCEEAEAVLRETVAAQLPDTAHGVVFCAKADSGSAVFQVPLSSVDTDCPATIARAWNIGNGESFLARGGVYLRCFLSGQEVLPAYADSDRLEDILTGMDNQMGRAAVPTTWELGETELLVTKGVPGNLVDCDSLRTEICDRLSAGEVVDLATAEPQFTVQLVQSMPEEISLPDVLAEVETQVQDAVFDKAGKVFKLSQRGITFDAAAAQETVDALGWGETAHIPLIITEPQVTLADLEPYLYQDVLGSCSSNISGTANRVQNINLAAQYFSGAVLMPGEVFSYNGTVGSRTKERGFLDAPAYVSGQSVQETGGGICQGSSTIYVAALRANLSIVERYNHSYITRYVPEGMDATVYYGAKDFRFENNTPFPIKVVGWVSGRTLTVNIMGTKTDNISVKMTNEVVGTTNYKTVYKVNSALPAGASTTTVTPYQGYTVKVYRNIYDNGVLIDTKLESTNVYKSRDKVIEVSPADAGKYGL